MTDLASLLGLNQSPAAVIYPDGLIPIGSSGPRTAKIVIVGEAPGEQEAKSLLPFVGPSGEELTKMLADAGINRADCYLTNVVLVRPPGNDIEAWVHKKPKFSGKPSKKETAKGILRDQYVPYRGWMVRHFIRDNHQQLIKDITDIKPNVVIAMGNVALWALCNVKPSIAKWRGSTLISDVIPGLKVIPVYHPAFILRMWAHRKISVQDLRRAKGESLSPVYTPPPWDFIPEPTFEQAYKWLHDLYLKLEAGEKVKMTADIECAGGKLLCVGIGISRYKALCLPFYKDRELYWPLEQAVVLNFLLIKVLSHANARVCNQNIPFDLQWLVRDLLCYPNIDHDTMVGQSVLFPGTKMSLDYLASMYCQQYRYWKDDGKFWITGKIDWPQLFTYNCEDAARTFEVWDAQIGAIAALKRQPQLDFQMKRLFGKVMRLMFRGVRRNKALAEAMHAELLAVSHYAEARVTFLAGQQLLAEKDWSGTRLRDFFYKQLRIPPVFNDEGEPTCDGDALVEIGRREPLVRELVRWITMHRSYSEAINVCTAKADNDGRWRCSYSMGLVETFRFSSSKNPFGRGLNLQNITSGKKTKGELLDD